VPPDQAAFAPEVGSVSEVRRFVAGFLIECSCPEPTIESALLLVSELATNAVVHAATPFGVRLSHSEQAVTIEVSDFSAGKPVERAPNPDGGRGLGIVAAISSEWGVRSEGAGKVVFCSLPCRRDDANGSAPHGLP
jgi:anti-sigma regulatory factor (Ser/Thr protein kinase)